MATMVKVTAFDRSAAGTFRCALLRGRAPAPAWRRRAAMYFPRHPPFRSAAYATRTPRIHRIALA